MYWVAWVATQPPRAAADASDILDVGRVAADADGHQMKKLATLVANSTSWNTGNPVCDLNVSDFDDLRVHEAETALEMPVNHTAGVWGGLVTPLDDRFRMVGNGFHVKPVVAILHMGKASIMDQPRMNTEGRRMEVK